MKLSSRPAAFELWRQWVIIHTLSLTIIITISSFLDYIPSAIIGWSIIGIVITIVQGWYLSHYIQLENWMFFSTIGWLGGVLIGKMAVGWQASSWDVDLALLGLVVGGTQYFSMRAAVLHAGWWVVASAVALILAGSLGGATDLVEDWFMFKGVIDLNRGVTERIGHILAGSVGGAVYGAITGGWLVWCIGNMPEQRWGE